jgi:hypothetical protein
MKDIQENLIALTGLTHNDFKVLRKAAPKIKAWGPALVKVFYDTLFKHEATAKIFKPGERPEREITLAQWYNGLIKGELDDHFWENQLLVGLIHIKRDVHNHMMFGMLSRVQTFFLEHSLKEFGLSEGYKLFISFKRITDVIAGLIAEGYFEKYLDAFESMSGIKRTVIHRMVTLEVDKMIEDARERYKL